MLSIIWRLLFLLRPFLREVFYSSSEEKRTWISRFMILLFLVGVVFFSIYKDTILGSEAIRKELDEKKIAYVELEKLHHLEQRKNDTLTHRLELKQSELDRLNGHNKDLTATLNSLKEEKAKVEKILSTTEHTLMECQSKKRPPNNENRLKGLDQ